MTFLALLEQIDPTRTALITQEDRVSFGALCAAALTARKATDLTGTRVFLNTRDIGAAIGAIAALDGLAASVAVTSPWQERNAVLPLLAVSDFDAVLTDAPDDFPAIPAPVTSLRGLGGAARAGSPQTDWIMTTSGTTGRPKMVRHNLASLTRSTRRDQVRGSEQVWGLLYDYTRFAGLQVVLQSLLAGSTLVVPPVEAPLDEKLAMLQAAGCTHLSATPTLWRKILMTPGSQTLALRQVTLGGEIADDTVLSSLAKAYPEARISHIFASTEAGVGFSVIDHKAGFPAHFLDAPPSGIGLKIENGLLHVRNENVGDDYLGEQGKVALDGWVNTGDRVAQRGDRVVFLGRDSGVINVGGDKVHPEEVEHVLLAHPAVEFVRVYARSNPIMGALVAADVVLREGAGEPAKLRPEITRFAASRLEKHKVPALLRFVDGFDLSVAGKLIRTS